MAGDTQQGFAGQEGLYAGNTPYNTIAFIFDQLIGRRAFVKVVKVEAVDQDARTVNVLPLLQQTDGLGQATEQLTVFGLPYLSFQGGKTAVVITPKAGDIGLCVVVDRDISALKEAKAPGPPASFRQNSLADGVYIGGILNGDPEQVVRITEDDGIELISTVKVKIEAPNIELNGEVAVEGTLTASEDVKVGLITLKTHRHTSAAAGLPTSAPIV